MYMEIYVHPSMGDDEAQGTSMHPYRTLAKAVSVIYGINSSLEPDEECRINIMLGCGVNKIDSRILLENLGRGMSVRFRPWDDMYTSLSCAVRINGFDFSFDKETGAYCYKSDSEIRGLYVNGRMVEPAKTRESLLPGCAFADKNMLLYCPEKNEEPPYSLTELAGSHNMFDIVNCSDITFENIDFTGIGDGKCSYITLDRCSGICIENCRFKNSQAEAVRCVNNSEKISIYNCEFVNLSAVCLEICNSRFVRVTNNYFDSCPEHSICVCDCENVSISSSTFHNTALPVCVVRNVSGLLFEKTRTESSLPGCQVLDADASECNMQISGNYILTDNSCLELVRNGTMSDNALKSDGELKPDNVMVIIVKNRININPSDVLGGYAVRVYVPEHWNPAKLEASVRDLILNAGYRKIIKNYGDII